MNANQITRVINDPFMVKVLETLFDSRVPKYMLCLSNLIGQVFENKCIHPTWNINKLILIFLSNIYIFYRINGNYFMDIFHIISNIVSNGNNFTQIYQKYLHCIKFSFPDCMMDGTSIWRELVDIATAYKIITSYDSDFSNIFRFEYGLRFLLICLFMLTIHQVELVSNSTDKWLAKYNSK